jgi:phosphohistidine phosphatase
LAADELGEAPDPVFDKRVYEASAKKLLAVVRDLPDRAGPAVLVGHNPGVADLVELLTGESPEMKTSAIAVLDLAGSWADARSGGADLVAYATPRG